MSFASFATPERGVRNNNNSVINNGSNNNGSNNGPNNTHMNVNNAGISSPPVPPPGTPEAVEEVTGVAPTNVKAPNQKKNNSGNQARAVGNGQGIRGSLTTLFDEAAAEAAKEAAAIPINEADPAAIQGGGSRKRRARKSKSKKSKSKKSKKSKKNVRRN